MAAWSPSFMAASKLLAVAVRKAAHSSERYLPYTEEAISSGLKVSQQTHGKV